MCTKTCNKCNNIYDISLFESKGSNGYNDIARRRGYCRICQYGYAFTRYKYPTKKQQKIADANRLKISAQLKVTKRIITPRVCNACKTAFCDRKKKYCTSCKDIANAISKKKKNKRQEQQRMKTGYYTKKQNKDREVLHDRYVRRMLCLCIKRSDGVKLFPSQIPEELVSLTKKKIEVRRNLGFGKVTSDISLVKKYY